MMKPAFSKTLLVFISMLALIVIAKPAAAKHNGSSKGGGSSHSGKSHGGGGSSHGGGHSKGASFKAPSFKAPSFKGGGHSYAQSGTRSSARFSSARMGSEPKNSGRMSSGSVAKSGGFSSRPTSNFARNSTFGGGSFGSSGGTRNSARFSGSQSVTQGTRGAMGNWQSFGNSAGRPVLASAHASGNTMGGAWRSFGNMSQNSVATMPRGNVSNLRAAGQWQSFGNTRNAAFGRNISGFSSFNTARASGSNTRWGGFGPGSNRFSPSAPVSTRVSSFSSFSSGLSTGNFGGSRFGGSRYGDSGFGNSSLGGSSFLNSGIGSGLSIFPNLLGGFLNIGTSFFGGPGVLAANALSLAVRLFVSGIEASGAGQGDVSGGGAGYGQGGYGGNFGLQADPVVPPACGVPIVAPGLMPGTFCQPYAYQPYGWGSIGYFGAPRVGFNYHW
jgi:hypothetical protein